MHSEKTSEPQRCNITCFQMIYRKVKVCFPPSFFLTIRKKSVGALSERQWTSEPQRWLSSKNISHRIFWKVDRISSFVLSLSSWADWSMNKRQTPKSRRWGIKTTETTPQRDISRTAAVNYQIPPISFPSWVSPFVMFLDYAAWLRLLFPSCGIPFPWLWLCCLFVLVVVSFVLVVRGFFVLVDWCWREGLIGCVVWREVKARHTVPFNR